MDTTRRTKMRPLREAVRELEAERAGKPLHWASRTVTCTRPIREALAEEARTARIAKARRAAKGGR